MKMLGRASKASHDLMAVAAATTSAAGCRGARGLLRNEKASSGVLLSMTTAGVGQLPATVNVSLNVMVSVAPVASCTSVPVFLATNAPAAPPSNPPTTVPVSLRFT